MADAYATFAASGKQADPYSVTAVKHRGSELPGFEKPRVTLAMPENVAHNVTDILENVIETGTGYKAQGLGRTAAGKTGTTDKNKSAWWVGYTQQLATSVAMFREDPKDHELLSMNGTAGEKSIHGGDVPTQIRRGRGRDRSAVSHSDRHGDRGRRGEGDAVGACVAHADRDHAAATDQHRHLRTVRLQLRRRR
jgi:membrane peptidoglycan carboxypeptidase